MAKELLYNGMPNPLKPELLPIEQYLMPDLPTIVGNVDYQTLKAQLLRIDQILISSGVEWDFIQRSVALKFEKATARAKKSVKFLQVIQEHSARALRCQILRVLLLEDFRNMSTRLADSPLLQRFVGIARIDKVHVPSKSTLQRYEQWLPEPEVRAVVQRLLVLATSGSQEGKPHVLDLVKPVDLSVCYIDTTCVKADIHYPTDWVLLKDAVHTLMQAVTLIRREGLLNRMENPKTFQTQINRLSIEMTNCRRKVGAKKEQKRILREMKALVKTAEKHARRHRDLLDQQWKQTELTRVEAQKIIERIDNILNQLPAVVKQAHDRIIGERQVKNSDKILSLYEKDAHVIVRGKAGAEVEFGNTLVLAEADDGLIVDWHIIREQAKADTFQVGESLCRMQGVFDDRIRAIVADRGCDSADNRSSLAFVKVENGIAPRNPQQLKSKMSDPIFAAWQKRRAQTEARIGIFKREFLGKPLRSRGFAHRELMVTWAVFVHDLWMLARRPRASVAALQAAA